MPLYQPLIRLLKCPDLFDAIDRMPALSTPVGELMFEVFNPSTGELLAELPDMRIAETRAAIDRA
ncbi:succinate-semialdehyde dehydrogenase (NADP(+)), partial [Mesorhizobium sp. M1A.F.Ca.IN.020.06.1.1]